MHIRANHELFLDKEQTVELSLSGSVKLLPHVVHIVGLTVLVHSRQMVK